MRRCLFCIVMLMLITVSATFAAEDQKKPATVKKSGSSASATTKSTAKTEAPKRIVGFDIGAMDKTVNPCTDFYQFSCGTWNKNNPIPADRVRWGRFDELQERNRDVLHDILEKAATAKKRSPMEQQYGDYYGACMDEKAAEAKGSMPIKPALDRIAAIKDKNQFISELATLRRQGIGGLFGIGVGADLHDSNKTMVNTAQAGIGLPDRDDYLKDDAKSKEKREKYVAHMQKMFELLGDSPDSAASSAKQVMAVETEMAKAYIDRVTLRDPKTRDNKMTKEQFFAMAFAFDVPRYLRETGFGEFSELNVVTVKYFKEMNGKIDTIPLNDWKTYLRWKVISNTAPMLSKAFVDESFEFNNKYLNGQKEQQDRWKRCITRTDGDLGQVLGQEYVRLTFGADGKARMMKLVTALEKALEADIKSLDWMTAETKGRAQEKLSTFTKKIGYPDKWKDYSSVKIVPDDAVANAMAVNEFEFRFNLAKLGKPVDKSEWGFTAPTVNASYSAQSNNITFPAGILQPPFFDRKIDDAVNFGGIGAVIGHEITHGFDDQGRKFDKDGNFKDWWTEADGKEYEKRSSCIADEYSEFVSVKDPVNGDVKHNGRLTLGENTADNGGVRIAYMALMATLAEGPKNKMNTKIDGFTPAQRLFIANAQIWCMNITEQNARQRAQTDPHSLGQYRVNGVVSNMPEFQKAFSCKAGDPMVRANACHVW